MRTEIYSFEVKFINFDLSTATTFAEYKFWHSSPLERKANPFAERFRFFFLLPHFSSVSVLIIISPNSNPGHPFIALTEFRWVNGSLMLPLAGERNETVLVPTLESFFPPPQPNLAGNNKGNEEAQQT